MNCARSHADDAAEAARPGDTQRSDAPELWSNTATFAGSK